MENTNIKKDETSTIKSLLEKGKDSGSLTYAEIAEALSTIDLDKDVIENTYETLSQLGIELVDEENKAGIQIMKKIQDNLNSGNPAVKKSVENLQTAFYFSKGS